MSFNKQSSDLEAARAIPIVGVVERYGIQLKRQGREHIGLCPLHQEKTASFSVNADRGFYHCFGCGLHGDVIDFVQAIEGIEFREAVERLTGALGDSQTRERLVRQAKTARQEAVHRGSLEDARKAKKARDILKASKLADSTYVATYLRSRYITRRIPPSIWFHPSLTHGPTGLRFPAMVAALKDSNRQIVGIHRTYLLPDGSGKARVSSPKMALGRISGAAVRLATATEMIGLAEGIETALSAMQLYGDPVWAACGSNMAGVIIPATVKRVVIYADNGEAGERAADKAAAEFYGQGRKVTIARPIEGYGDFNDYLQAQRRVA